MPFMGNKQNKTPIEKGNDLELAVGAIERVILDLEPTAKDKKFTFEFKKLFIVQGVKHEIDIYVTVEFAAGYQGKFGFECKNWAKPVNKNEIMIFSGKIQVLGLSHGYFVAPSFTEDARAQAKLDNRLTLLTVTKHDPLLLTEFASYLVRHRYENFGADIYRRDGRPLQVPTENVQPQIRYQGKIIGLEELAREWVRLDLREKLRDFAANQSEGDYPFAIDFVREFPPGEMEIEGQDVEKMHFRGDGTASIYRQAITSSFEIESRGRIISYAPSEVPGMSLGPSHIIFVYGDQAKE
jgi:hypothetical protein